MASRDWQYAIFHAARKFQPFSWFKLHRVFRIALAFLGYYQSCEFHQGEILAHESIYIHPYYVRYPLKSSVSVLRSFSHVDDRHTLRFVDMDFQSIPVIRR